MNKFLTLGVLSLAMALTACGGDSDSSGNHNKSFTSKLGNGNSYSCPSEAALKQCKTDSTCSVAQCTLTNEVAPPSDTTVSTKCQVKDKVVTGLKSKSCKFIEPAVEANMTLTCRGSNIELDGSMKGLNASGGSTLPAGTTISGYKLTCP